ncbi:MAG: DUF4091 domain-containing protein [Armatimonadota bacterium]|nr:DUF4091 domain-containing protein [Armatimonadota bacterium]
MSAWDAFAVAAIATLLLCTSAGAEQALWPVNCLTKVMPDTPPGGGGAIEIEGARGETVSAQAAIRSDEPLAGAQPSITALSGAEGEIPANAMGLLWERFIDITRNSPLPEDVMVAKAPASIPDPFWEQPARDIPADATQPLWLEIAIPREAAPGRYEGELTVRWEGGEAALPLRLRVRDFEMPQERHLMVTNWFTFPGVPWRDTVETGSDQYWELARKFAEIMGRHRQNVFRAWLSWASFSYDPDHGFSADWSRFDRWAETFFDTGYFDRMEIWGTGRRTGSHTGLDTRIIMVDFSVETPEGVELTTEEKFRGVLGLLEEHLQERGWQDRAMIHVCDEPFQPSVPTYRQIADLVHEVAPSLKIIEAIEAEGFGDSLDVWVPKLSHLNLWWENFREEKRGRDIELWFYTCCHPVGRYPNRFLDQPLTAVRALHWIDYLYDLDGYLHWGLNHYHGDQPFTEEGISGPHPLGDHAIMYPTEDGPMGSLRWSAMRDGIQDFEYLWLLTRRLTELKQRLGDDGWWLDPRQRPEELCRRVVQSFYRYNPDAGRLLEARSLIADEIEALQNDPLLFVQTSPPEHTEIPAGPRLINIYGAADPGAVISVNGEEKLTVGESGTFEMPHFIGGDGVVRITAALDGRQAHADRAFVLTE